ncbi:hypothetical protein ACFW9W_43835, partial [Streptomyces sp. NPDC059468]
SGVIGGTGVVGGTSAGKGNEGVIGVGGVVGNVGNFGHKNEGNRGHEEEEEGRIQINERTYSSHPGDCITVVLLDATSLNIRNDSRRAIDVFDGPVCDSGAPLATVGPHDDAFGVTPTRKLASFWVIDERRRDRDHDRDDW